MRLTFTRSDQVPNRHRKSVSMGRRSTAVVQRFCKPKVGSSILSAGTIPPATGTTSLQNCIFFERPGIANRVRGWSSRL